MTANVMFGCYACRTLFGYNDELASLPGGNKFAFDPSHNRVWRVCTHCGDWGLLGPETSALAMPELEARFAAAVQASTEDVAVAGVSDTLELIRLGPHTIPGRGDFAAATRRKAIDRQTLILSVGSAAMWGWLLWYTFFGHRGPVEVIGNGLLLASWMLLAQACWGWRYRTPVPAWRVLATLAAFLFAAWVGIIESNVLWHARTAVELVLVLALFACFARPRQVLRMKLPHDAVLQVNEFEAKHVSLEWTGAERELSLHDLPGGGALEGELATRVLRRLLDFLTRGSPRAVTEEAYRLVRATGGLKGVLALLDGWRDDNGGRVVVHELPRVYRVAIDLALAEDASPLDSHEQIHLRAVEAAAVAAEAEALDGDLLT